MRIAQLARKLSVKPGEISAFLELNQIKADGSNFKLEDAQVALILRHFGQELEPNTTDELPAAGELTKVHERPQEQIDSAKARIPEEEGRISQEISEDPDNISTLAQKEEKPEVIKVPKAELPGLRVIGKIDLPESKLKKTPSSDLEYNDEIEPVLRKPAGSHESRKQKRDSASRSKKNPIIVRRERDARETEQKMKAMALLEKEKRTQNYLRKIKDPVPTKPTRPYREPVVDISQEIQETPSSWWGRFMKWFRRE
jgi:hypothetical protein